MRQRRHQAKLPNQKSDTAASGDFAAHRVCGTAFVSEFVGVKFLPVALNADQRYLTERAFGAEILVVMPHPMAIDMMTGYQTFQTFQHDAYSRVGDPGSLRQTISQLDLYL